MENYLTRGKSGSPLIAGATYCPSCGLLSEFMYPTSIVTSTHSPVPHLIKNNRMPSKLSECKDIDEGLEMAEKELSAIEKELARLAYLAAQLKARKDQLYAYREEHSRLKKFNPTYYLPKELWMEIFLCHQAFLRSESMPKFLPKPNSSNSSKAIITSFDPRHGPLLLSQICRRWRDIALNTAGLWSTIRIVLDKSHISPSTLDLLDLWHTRSLQASLDIQILLLQAPTYSPDMKTTKTEVLQKLATQSHRWEQLYLVVPPAFVFKGLWSIKGKLPNLRKCILHCPDDTARSWVMRDLGEDIFEVAPRLDTLILDNTSHLLKSLKIPYHQLVWLDMKRCLKYNNDILTPFDCIQLLRLCPQLKTCKITCGYWDGALLNEFTHPTLEDLRIYGAVQGDARFGHGGIGVFLEHLTTPNLHALSLDVRTSSTRSLLLRIPTSQLNTFLSRCPVLTNLSIIAFGAVEDPKELSGCLLSLFPSQTRSKFEFDFWLSEEIGEPLLDELDGYMHDETNVLPWLPDKIYYSYVPGRPGYMVVGTKQFYHEDEGGHIYRLTEDEILRCWMGKHACLGKMVEFGYTNGQWGRALGVGPVMMF